METDNEHGVNRLESSTVWSGLAVTQGNAEGVLTFEGCCNAGGGRAQVAIVEFDSSGN